MPLIEEKQKIQLPATKWPPFETSLQNNQKALEWLLSVRGITAETAKDLRLGFTQSCKGYLSPEQEVARNAGWIMFPRLAGGKLLAVKMRGIGAKAFSQWAGMDAKALFNSDDINALEPVFVTEGEFDTAIFKQAGFVAVSIPNASTKLTPEMRILLKKAACIYLAGDNDGGAGNAAMKQLARELGDNTFMLVWPGAKDANEFFLKTCNRSIETFREQVEILIAAAQSTPIEGFTSLLARLRTTGGSDAGADPNRLHFPIPAVDNMNYNPPGSVVVFYSTYTGTGKTIFTTQVMLHEAKRGEVVVVYSPELRDEQYLALVASQTLGINRAERISKEQYEETANVLDKTTERGGSFTYYVGHSLPVSDTEEVLGFIEQTIRVTGATRFVIDTLHRIIGVGPRENMAQAEGRVVKQLEALSVKYGTIFILIGQSNKEAEAIKEQRHDSEGVLRGSRELSDVAYGIYLLHRKRKTGTQITAILEMETDVILKKDRGKGPGAAVAYLLFRPQSSKFVELDTTNREQEAPPMISGLDDSGY